MGSVTELNSPRSGGGTPYFIKQTLSRNELMSAAEHLVRGGGSRGSA